MGRACGPPRLHLPPASDWCRAWCEPNGIPHACRRLWLLKGSQQFHVREQWRPTRSRPTGHPLPAAGAGWPPALTGAEVASGAGSEPSLGCLDHGERCGFRAKPSAVNRYKAWGAARPTSPCSPETVPAPSQGHGEPAVSTWAPQRGQLRTRAEPLWRPGRHRPRCHMVCPRGAVW